MAGARHDMCELTRPGIAGERIGMAWTQHGICELALSAQYAKRMRRNVLPSVVCLVPPYFSTLFNKRCDFRKNVTDHKMCVLIFSTDFV
jgi:hypothetical protein